MAHVRGLVLSGPCLFLAALFVYWYGYRKSSIPWATFPFAVALAAWLGVGWTLLSGAAAQAFAVGAGLVFPFWKLAVPKLRVIRSPWMAAGMLLPAVATWAGVALVGRDLLFQGLAAGVAFSAAVVTTLEVAARHGAKRNSMSVDRKARSTAAPLPR